MFVSILEIALTIASLIGASPTKEALKAMYWSSFKYEGNKVYWGLFAFYGDKNSVVWYESGNSVVEYTDNLCTTNPCTNCNQASEVVAAFSSITLIAALVSLLFLILRCFSSYNTFLFKTITIVSTLVTLLATIVSLIVWGGLCQASLDNQYNKVAMGPGFILALIVAIMCLISLIINTFLTSSTTPTANPELKESLDPNAMFPSAPYAISNGTTSNPNHGQVHCSFCGRNYSTVLTASNPIIPGHCMFCGKKHARENASFVGEQSRFCVVCGKKHVIEEGLKFCSSCGDQLRF